MAEKKKYPAEVAKIVSDYKIVINRGSNDGITLDQKFLIYSITDEEVFDPVTKESLGFLEYPKGTGKVTHVQEKMSTLESDMGETDPMKRLTASLTSLSKKPFVNINVGDKVKPV